MTPKEFVEKYPLTSTSVAFLAGVSTSSGMLSGKLATRLAARGGPTATAVHRMVTSATPMVRAMAVNAARNYVRQTIKRASRR